jgi:putative salt-induced outer membrane protein
VAIAPLSFEALERGQFDGLQLLRSDAGRIRRRLPVLSHKIMKKILAVAVLTCLTSPATAQGTAAPKKWKDVAELSYVQTTGNSKTSTLSAKDLYNYDWEKAALELNAGGLGSKNRGIETAEQYNASEKISLKMPGKNYAFQKIMWDKNRFAGISNRYDMGLGIGRHFLETPDDRLFAEAGGGYVFEDRSGASNQTFGAYRGYGKYIRTLSATANASQDLEYLGNFRRPAGYRINAETALVTSISTHFSLKASYQWKYSNSPGPDFNKTDTMTAVALIVNY